MAESNRMRLITRPEGMVRTRPIKWNGAIKWPWVMTDDQRRADANASRGQTLNYELLDRILEERTLRANAKG
jgi:hypothetical protein